MSDYHEVHRVMKNKERSVEEIVEEARHFINMEEKFLEKEDWVKYIIDTVRKDTMTNKIDQRVEEFIKLRVAKFEGVVNQHLGACDGEIGESDLSDYFEEEIREIIKVKDTQTRQEAYADGYKHGKFETEVTDEV